MSRAIPSCRRALFQGFPTLFMLVALGGCGSGQTRLSGKVTFAGKPIPAGKIYFSPDGRKGGSGAPGYAVIKDGAYDTAAPGGMGVAKGAMIVTIEGHDPSAPKDKPVKAGGGEDPIKPLFPRYETTVELTGEANKDFDVPADATKPKKAAQGGP